MDLGGSCRPQLSAIFGQRCGSFVLVGFVGIFLLHVLRESAALDHESVHDAMKNQPVIEFFIYIAEKVFDRTGNLVRPTISIEIVIKQDIALLLKAVNHHIVTLRPPGLVPQLAQRQPVLLPVF